MAGVSKGLVAAAAVALMLAGACASDEEAAVEEQTPESQGFAWVGQGEPSNFATDYAFCRRTIGVERTPQFSQGADGSIDAFSTQRRTSMRSDYATKRHFWMCMQSQGWELVSAR